MNRSPATEEIDARLLRAARTDLRARVPQARAAGRSARDGKPGWPRRSPAAACSKWRAAPAGGHRTARVMRRELARTDLNPETMAVAQCKALPPNVRFATVDAYTFAGLEGAALRRRVRGLLVEPRAAGAPGALAAHAACAARTRRAGGDARQPLRRRQQHSDRTARRRGQHLSRTPLDDGSVHEVLKNFPRAPRPLRRSVRAHAPTSGSNTVTTGSSATS